MRAKVLLPVLAAALFGLAACDIEDFEGLGNFQRYQRDFHYNYPLNANGSLSVETFNGSVEISGWDQNTVDISGVKYGSSEAQADDLKIQIDNTPTAVSIRVVRPSVRRGNLGARFTIKIPRTALLDRIVSSNGAIRTLNGSGPARLRTSNGQIRVEDLKGSLDAQTSNSSIELLGVDGDAKVSSSNGHIRVEGLRGSLDAGTSNSSINARIMQGAKGVRLETSNGSIDLTLPANYSNDLRAGTSNSSITVRLPGQANAHVIAHTSNGSINSDFEIRMQGSISKNHVEGTIGNGGALIDLGTSNGGIRLLRI